MKKNVIKIIIGTIILEVLLICLFILTGSFDWKSLASGGIIICYSIPCLFYSKICDIEKYKNIAIIGTIIAGLLAVIHIFLLWELISFSDSLIKVTSTFSVIMWVLAIISAYFSIDSNNKTLNLFKKIGVTLITILGFLTIIIIWSGEFIFDGFFARFFLMIIVLNIGSFIVTGILQKTDEKEKKKIQNRQFAMQQNNIQYNDLQQGNVNNNDN